MKNNEKMFIYIQNFENVFKNVPYPAHGNLKPFITIFNGDRYELS